MMSKSILIIDDDQRLRELLEDYLKEKKYKIYLCDDFSSANEILQYFPVSTLTLGYRRSNKSSMLIILMKLQFEQGRFSSWGK